MRHEPPSGSGRAYRGHLVGRGLRTRRTGNRRPARRPPRARPVLRPPLPRPLHGCGKGAPALAPSPLRQGRGGLATSDLQRPHSPAPHHTPHIGNTGNWQHLHIGNTPHPLGTRPIPAAAAREIPHASPQSPNTTHAENGG